MLQEGQGAAMDDEFIMISIIDSGRRIETRRCRTAPLPDGSRGALWRGLVWPIGDGDRIELTGPAFPYCSNKQPRAPASA